MSEFILIPGVLYYWKRTGSWQFNGAERWWEIYIVFEDGFNGSGGACIREIWRWNNSSQNMRDQPRNLNIPETVALLGELAQVSIKET